jgi:uncharacterized membrane protein YeaQ/YmgE (transglycosylase-associated protein family)
MHDPGFYSWFWFLVVGGLAGWIASVLVRGSGLGLIGDVAAGVVGAFLGGYMVRGLNITVYGFWGVLGMSILGAVLLLSVLRLLTQTRKGFF